jgi:hypothetical protein
MDPGFRMMHMKQKGAPSTASEKGTRVDGQAAMVASPAWRAAIWSLMDDG